MSFDRQHRFSSILFVAIDVGTEPPAALGNALAFAESHGARFTLYDVVPPAPKLRRIVRPSPVDTTAIAANLIEAELDRWLESFSANVAVSTAVDVGRRPTEVVARVVRNGHDLVIVAPDGSAGSLSTVRRLIRVCPCPVLVLRGSVLAGNVIAAVDPDDRLDLNISILHIAASTAEDALGAIHIVNAYEHHGSNLMLTSEAGPLGANEFARFGDQIKSSHHSALIELVNRVGVPEPYAMHVVAGEPAAAVASMQDQLGASTIVVGSAGRRGMEAMLIGNTAERLVATTRCSLLVVKPAGFDPVTGLETTPTSLTEQAGLEALSHG